MAAPNRLWSASVLQTKSAARKRRINQTSPSNCRIPPTLMKREAIFFCLHLGEERRRIVSGREMIFGGDLYSRIAARLLV